MNKGYIQVYTGNGKGKTTAAIGLGVRAAGYKRQVYMVQFLKNTPTGELDSLKLLEPYFKLFRFQKTKGFFWNLNDEEKKILKAEVQETYDFIVKVMREGSCEVLILDEILGAYKNELITEEQIIYLIDIKPIEMELILTGRNAPEWLVNKADLVTEMKDIKHYAEKGIMARKGIEY
ncbi:cob(I)alamin adenosyltransferase [Clostridium amylolyticum]|uniref:Cob(I)alamin adenosyltransferase n=1 Tax=Clostridium amylolyticum TaxID=1121298 RepID=A0A1M6GNX2_9CLOT|nr:cob(I)yrinic acid a,c-diamide adenosyltransferase [Clostridium amylolyticum]SHJ11644.1 cob(I)alamin adenosyltransferase [Clostridium amylolyticum]